VLIDCGVVLDVDIKLIGLNDDDAADAENDLERVVLFEDVRPFVVEFSLVLMIHFFKKTKNFNINHFI